MATLITKNSSTAAAVPGTGDLVQGELAVNVTDKRLFTKNAGGSVVEVGTNPSTMVVEGNMGVGVTPGYAQAGWNILQCSRDATFGGVAGGPVYGFMAVNAYPDLTTDPTTATWGYRLTGSLASRYDQNAGQHRWFTAPSGTAGSPISFTQAMTLDASGNLGLGVTPSAWTTGSGVKAAQIASGVSVWGTSTASQGIFGTNSYFDGTNFRRIATDSAAYYQQLTGAHSWHVAGSAAAGSTISFTQAMTLDASGNLGLGVTPTAQSNYAIFDIKGRATGQSAILNFFDGAGTKTGAIQSDTNFGVLLAAEGARPIPFFTNGSERARITSGGDLLVGTTNASVGTAVGCRIVDSGARLEVAKAATTNADIGLSQYSTGAGAYRFYVGYGGTVYATSTTITAISDQRLKENIRDLDVGLDKIMALKPRKFDWRPGKGKDKKGDRGWIAQEFEQVFPDMVDTWQDPAPEGEEPYKAVNADLIPVLVKAIQEQQAIIEDLRARVAALETA